MFTRNAGRSGDVSETSEAGCPLDWVARCSTISLKLNRGRLFGTEPGNAQLRLFQIKMIDGRGKVEQAAPEVQFQFQLRKSAKAGVARFAREC